MNSDINLKHLEYFIKVAQLGSINKAAQALFISQPYLGKIINDLEYEAGCLLLNRSNHGVTLTPEGEEFERRAANVLAEVAQLWQRSAKGSGDFSHLSVSMTKFSHVMESFIEVIMNHRDQPEFTHRLYGGNPEDVIEDVLSGRATVGIIHFDSRRRREIEETLLTQGISYTRLAHMEPHLVVAKNHPLALKKEPIDLQELSDYGFVRYLGQCDDLIYSLFDAELRRGKVSSPKVIYVSDRETLLRLISVSDFYGVGIRSFQNQDPGYGSVSIPIPQCDFMFVFGYIMTEGTVLSDITKEFIKNVKDRLN